MNKSHLLGAVCLCVFTTSTNAALIGRLAATPGGTDYQAYYDDKLNITWAADVIVTGHDTWANQTNWATTLTIDGITGWRLPDVDVNNDGIIVNCASASDSACQDNELGYQLYKNGVTLTAPGPFTNYNQSGIYVSSTEYAPDPDFVWDVSISLTRGIGSFGAHTKTTSTFFAWAVHDGDVAASIVPAPASVWLFGSGLLGLISMARRKKAA